MSDCIRIDPLSLDPAAKAARVPRQIADLLAKVAKRLEARDHNPERVSGFLMRLLFTMFAEDSKLIPEARRGTEWTGLIRAGHRSAILAGNTKFHLTTPDSEKCLAPPRGDTNTF